jgi:hypothetical protein
MPTTRAAPLLLFAASCTRPAAPPAAPDPVSTDGDKYHVLFENDRVRVLRYHDEPGAKTHLHHHPDFVMVVLAPFRRELTFADGSKRTRDFRASETVWMTAQDHVGENVGTTPTDVVLIEPKER